MSMNQTQQIFPLRPGQIEDLSFHMRNPRGGNLSDPAAGKTAPANVWMYELATKYQAKTVFLMPTSLFKQNWKSFFKFTHFKPEEIVILRGTPAKRKKLMQNPDAKVFIASFNFFAPKPGRKEKRNEFGVVTQEAKPQGKSEYQLLKEAGHKIEALVVDEWHMGFKTISAARTLHLCWNVHNEIPIFVPLTGTAVDGHLSSVYPLIHCLEPRYYMNYDDFLNQHAIYDFFGTKIEGWRNVEKVKEILSRHCIRHTFEEVHGKDATVTVHQEYEMSDAHREFYMEYEDTAMMETPQGFREAAHGGEYVLRLRQIANCPEIFFEKFGVTKAKELELMKDEGFRINVLQALQTNKRFLVFAASKSEQRRLVKIAQEEGARVGLLNGNVPQGRQREKVDDDFTAHRLDGVIASPDVVSVGYDWNFLDIVMFYSADYRDSSFFQGYRRGVRGHRDHPLLVYVMYYLDSVEVDILQVMESKMETANATDASRKIFELVKKRHADLTLTHDKPGQRLTLAGMGLSKK